MNKTAAILCALLVVMGCTQSGVQKGNTCLRLGDYELAADFFRKALRRTPDDFQARLGLGKALLQRAADRSDDTSSWREALVHLEAARTLQPQGAHLKLLSTVWFERGKTLLRGRDTLSALEALTKAIEHDPRSIEPLNAVGIVYFRMGEAGKSKAIFMRALDVDSSDISANFNLGMVFWSQDSIADAHRHWLRALQVAPADEDILYWFAVAEKRMRESTTGNSGEGSP